MAKRKRRNPINGDGRGAHCEYCERRLESTASLSKLAATRDHVWPKSLGGTYEVWSCRQCNNLKADMTPDEWRAFRDANPEWWRNPQYQRGTLVRHNLTMAEAAAISASDPRFATGYYVPQPPDDPKPRVAPNVSPPPATV